MKNCFPVVRVYLNDKHIIVGGLCRCDQVFKIRDEVIDRLELSDDIDLYVNGELLDPEAYLNETDLATYQVIDVYNERQRLFSKLKKRLNLDVEYDSEDLTKILVKKLNQSENMNDIYNDIWDKLKDEERNIFRNRLVFKKEMKELPNGYPTESTKHSELVEYFEKYILQETKQLIVEFLEESDPADFDEEILSVVLETKDNLARQKLIKKLILSS